MPPRIKGPPQRGRHYIKEWREAAELTQAQLAERLGMSEASLSRIESRRQPYTQDVLEAIAVALGVEASWLISRRPQEGEPFSDMPDDVRAQVTAIAKILMGGKG